MKITVIGGGNMGGAIVRGLIWRSVVDAASLSVADPSAQVRESLAAYDASITLFENNSDAVKGADLVIVAVKPWLMEQVCVSIKDAFDPNNQMFASIAAGVAIDSIAEWLEAPSATIFRIIPNTAISLGESVTFLASRSASTTQMEQVSALFHPLGMVFPTTEQQITALTALASCGIAYALRYIDSSARGGEQMGIAYEDSLRIVLQTVKGALALLETNASHPQTEIDKVTTPGGITLKGLEEMERSGFSQAVVNGLKASK